VLLFLVLFILIKTCKLMQICNKLLLTSLELNRLMALYHSAIVHVGKLPCAGHLCKWCIVVRNGGINYKLYMSRFLGLKFMSYRRTDRRTDRRGTVLNAAFCCASLGLCSTALAQQNAGAVAASSTPNSPKHRRHSSIT